MVEKVSAEMHPTAPTMGVFTPASERMAAKTKSEKDKVFILCVEFVAGWLAPP